MSFFTELRQRNVFKVAFAYLVVGWLLIQVAEVLAPQMNLPEWTSRMVTFFVMLGFPVALVMAWALELTPEGVRKSSGSNTPIYAIAALLLAASFYWFFSKQTVPVSTAVVEAVETALPATAQTEIPSVAVLPFENMSPDPDNEYFSDGISEELLNLLVRVEGLRIPSRTSSFAFKGKQMDIREIARELEVGHVLEGSVRKAGNRVRITAQLIDVSTDTHLWSETYDRELADIFAIQDEIAVQIVEALKLALAPQLADSGRTHDLEAYNLYLQGRFQFQKRGASLREAETLLLQAVELEPTFGEAFAVLAMVYTQFPNYLGMESDEPHAKALEMANRALEIDPGLVEASMSIAQVMSDAGQWQDSLSLYEVIAAQHPRHALAHLWFGITLFEAGYLSKAVEMIDRALGLDPASGLALDWQARVLVATGRANEAVAPATRAFQLGRVQARVPLAYQVAANGDGDPLRAILADANDAPSVVFGQFLDLVAVPAGFQAAMDWIDSSPEMQQARPGMVEYARMMFLTIGGNPEQIYRQLSRVATFDHSIVTTSWLPYLKHFRQSPYFVQWAEDQNLLTLWQQRGWPDLCRPSGENDIECD
jgi:TolB-like protein